MSFISREEFRRKIVNQSIVNGVDFKLEYWNNIINNIILQEIGNREKET